MSLYFTCLTLFIHFSAETACGQVMRQVASMDEGYESDCTYIDWLFGLTIEQCKIEACLSGANVINYDPSFRDCEMVSCSDNDYKLISGSFAFDVYSLELEGKSIVSFIHIYVRILYSTRIQ